MTIGTQRLRFLRGNTAASSAFTGLGGELIVDTDLNSIRVQDGYTPGGTLLATAAQLANVSGSYGNANVAAYLPTYTGNVNAAYFIGNGALLTGIVATGTNYGNANVAAYLVDNPPPGTYSNTNVAAYLVANPQPGTYSDSNVASYLPTYTGNIAANIVKNGHTWYFHANGALVVPGTILHSTGSSIVSLADNSVQMFANSFTGASGIDIQEVHTFVKAGGDIILIANSSTIPSTWEFAAGGNLRLPTNTSVITYQNGINILEDIVSNTVTGNVGTFNTLYGQLGTSAQPGITSLGTLTGVAVSGTTSTSALQVNGNATIGNLLVTGTSTIIGNINQISGNSGQFFGNSPTGFGALYAGIASGFTPLQQTIVQSSGNYNEYVQVNLENVNSGNAATGDYIVTADNGTDSTYYVDMGIAGSNFDSLSPNIVGNSVRANDAYLYTLGNGAGNQGGNLIIGAGTTSKVVKIIAGGGHDHDVVATVSAGAFTVNGNITGSYILGNGSQLSSVSAVSATYVTGLTSANVTTALGFVPADSNAASNYGNANVAAYLPTYTGNISFGNLVLSSNSSNIVFKNGATIYGDAGGLGRNGSIVLQPAATGTFPSVIVGGAGRLAAPNGSVHQIFNTNDVTFQVAVKNITGIAATSTTTGALQITGGGGFTGNVYSGGNIVASGNVTGSHFIGNGALLTGITVSANYGNTNVSSFLGAYGSNTIVTTGNISAGYFVGNGALLTGIVASGSTYANSNVADYLASNSAVPIITTGNVTAAYYIGDGSQLTGITASANYDNSNVATFLSNIGSNAIVTTSNVTASYFLGNGALLTGLSTYSNANVVSMLAANTYVGIGNVVNAYTTASNITTIFVGNSTTVATGGSGSGSGQTNLLNNLYHDATSALRYRNTQTGAASLTMGGSSGFSFAGTTSGVTANAASGMGIWATLNGSVLQTYNSIGVTSSGTITTTSGVLATGAVVSTVFNTVASTVNMGGAATTIAMGASTVSVSMGSGTGNLTVGNITSAGNLTIANITSNTSVTTGALAITSGGNISGVGNLVGVSANTTISAGLYTTTFDNAGNVTVSGNLVINGVYAGYAPTRAAVRLYGNTSTNWTAGTTLSNQVVDYNQGNYYNNSTGLFTAPVGGLYHCYATIRVGNNNALNQAALLKNGTLGGANVVAFWETDTNAGVASHFSITGYAKCVAGDTLSLKVIAGNVQFDSNDSWGVTYIG